jgi:hypothetical protein
LKKRALQIGLPRDKNRNLRTNENTNGVGFHPTLPATRINYYKQVEACVLTTISAALQILCTSPRTWSSGIRDTIQDVEILGFSLNKSMSSRSGIILQGTEYNFLPFSANICTKNTFSLWTFVPCPTPASYGPELKTFSVVRSIHEKKGPTLNKLQQKVFWFLNRLLGHKQLQKKNRPKSDHGKWVKFLVLALPLAITYSTDKK